MKKKKAKIIYFCDIPMDGKPADEWKLHESDLKRHGLKIGEVEATTLPPFDKQFDILFFDWGGMGSLGCTGLFESFCEEIIKLADENPSRMFVMASTFTTSAMKDALYKLYGEDKRTMPNVFLDFRSFVDACENQGLVKRGRLVWK